VVVDSLKRSHFNTSTACVVLCWWCYFWHMSVWTMQMSTIWLASCCCLSNQFYRIIFGVIYLCDW